MSNPTATTSSFALNDWLSAESGKLTGNALRSQALEHLLAQGLPAGKHEEYRFTPLTRILENMTGSVGGPAVKSVDNNIPAIPGAAARVVLRNGLCEIPSAQPAGVVITSGDELSGLDFKDGFALLNCCLQREVLRITSDSAQDVIIHIHHLSDNMCTAPAINIQVAENSHLTIVETFSHSGHQEFITSVLRADVSPSAHFSWYALQDFSDNTNFISNSRVRIAAGAVANSFVLTSGGGIVRNNPVFEMAGQGSESNVYGLYLIKGRTLADNHTVVDHQVPNANSNELYKGVMAGQSRGVFNGKIFVRPDAQKTNAFQSNRNILLSENATVNTKPQLEIWADDVKCSHGCTSGQLDEEALFYLRSRGIDRPSATAMLLDAFAGQVIDKLPHENLRELIRSLALNRISGLS